MVTCGIIFLLFSLIGKDVNIGLQVITCLFKINSFLINLSMANKILGSDKLNSEFLTKEITKNLTNTLLSFLFFHLCARLIIQLFHCFNG
jgi:hypothetical protein